VFVYANCDVMRNMITYKEYSPEAKHTYGRIMEILYRTKNGVHAFGYNSTESKPIWM